MNLLCAHSEPFSETLPSSGLMQNGRLYARPMPGHLIDANESLLLRTPVADETGGGPQSPAMAKHRGQTLRLTGQIIDLVEPGRLPQPLLPTPNTMEHLPVREGDDYEKHLYRDDLTGSRRAHGSNLREVIVNELLPTPTTQDGSNTAGPSQTLTTTGSTND